MNYEKIWFVIIFSLYPVGVFHHLHLDATAIAIDLVPLIVCAIAKTQVDLNMGPKYWAYRKGSCFFHFTCFVT